MKFRIILLFALLLFLIPSIYSQDIGIMEDEKLLVWLANAQRPGRQTANEPGELVWIDSEGNFETFMQLPPQTSHVMTCGQSSALSPDGESLAFYIGADVGTLHILKGTDSLFVVDTDFHAMGCTGVGTFEFFPDSSKFAYIDYDPNSLTDSFGQGTLRIYNNVTSEQIRNFEQVISFDVAGEQVAYARFFDNDRNESIEAAIVLWDGESDREVATLFAQDGCLYNSVEIQLVENGNIMAVMGHRCSTGDSRTNWQYYIIDPVNRTATQITQNPQPGRYFAFSRTNSLFTSPDGTTSYFTVPDGLTNNTVSLMRADMNVMSINPVIPEHIVMPRFTNDPYAMENHPLIQSPNASWLSMVQNNANDEATLSIFDLSQPDLLPIEFGAGSRGDQIIEMVFTPDNERVLYVAGGNNGDDNSLWGVDLATGNNFRVRRGQYGWGVISPDGERMALINWVPTDNNQPPYATLVVVDIESASESLLFTGGELVSDTLTGVRFALPIAWR